MPDEYDYGVVQGSLKLKKPKGLFKKKQKKKSKSKKDKEKQPPNPTTDDDTGGGMTKTEAEKRFDEMQKKRKLEHIERLAGKSFGDRVKEFNEKLERTPEHNDIPKVGPG